MGSVGSDELLVARQADDGGAGELLRRHGAAGGRRGVGQVPRRHGLEEPLGRRRACGRAGRRRWRPVGSSRHAQSAARGGARTSKEPKDTASEPGSAATTSTRRSDRSAARLLRGRVAFASRRRYEEGRGRETARETKTGRPLAAPSPPAGSTPGLRGPRRPARVSAGSRRPTPRRWRRCPSWAASSSTRPCAR